MSWALTAAPVESAQEHVILITLADRAADDGSAAWPSQDWIATRARCSTRTVRRHLQALEARGLIRRGDQTLVAHLRADSRPIVWDLALEVSKPPVDKPVRDGRTRLSARSPEVERPDTGVRSGRTLLSYKPSLDTPRDTPTHRETRRPARSCSPSPARTVVVNSPSQITALADACRSRGLSARWDRLRPEQETMIGALLEAHGVAALADAAERAHRPTDPTRYAQGYLGAWAELAPPRPAAAPRSASCGACDEFGWLPDDAQGRAVRCACRAATAAAA